MARLGETDSTLARQRSVRGRKGCERLKASDAKNGDLLVALGFVLGGGFVVFESLRMPYWEQDTYLMSPGIVPLLAGSVLCLLGLVYGGQSVGSGALRGWPRWVRDLASNEETHRLVVLLSLVLIYGIGLIGRVPFFVATLVFHAGIFGYLRVGGWLKWGVCTAGATVFVAVLLPRLFDMPLPEVE